MLWLISRMFSIKQQKKASFLKNFQLSKRIKENSANIFCLFFDILKFSQTLLLSRSAISLFLDRRCEVVDKNDKCSWLVAVFSEDIFGFINDVDGKSISLGDFVVSSGMPTFSNFKTDLNWGIYSIYIIVKLK